MLTIVVAAFFFCTALATKFISPASRCGRDPRRCLLLSSNPPQPRRAQESAETREINTWYPIPRQKVLFDTRKNSEAGFATNFNKLVPRGADGYPHANDFQRGGRLLEKGEAVEEFGIRFRSLTDGENKGGTANRMGGMERLAKWNDTAGGGAISFALNNTVKKSNAEFRSADTYRVNNSFVKTNKLGTSLTTEKPIEESEEFLNIRAMDGSVNPVPSYEFPREYLNTENKQEKPDDTLYVSAFPGIFQKSLPTEIFNPADLESYSLNANSAVDERNHNLEFPELNKEDNKNNINKGIGSTGNDYAGLKFPGHASFVNFSADNKANADGVLSGYDKMRNIDISKAESKTFKPKLTNERNKSDTIYRPLDRSEIKDDGKKVKYIKTGLDRNYQLELNLPEYRPIGSLGPYKIVKLNGSQFPEVIATLHLEISDAKPMRQNREARDVNHILSQSTKLFQNKTNQDKNSLNSASLPAICESTTCLEEKSNLNIKDSDSQFHKMLSETKVPASFKRRRSTDVLKTSQVRYISDFYSKKILKHNKRSARGADSRETGKLHQTEATDLKKEDFGAISVSDNVSVATESWKSYQTGTLVGDEVTTPPSLSNEVSPKNDSVPKFDVEGRKKFELQIDEEDSLDKDLGALKMETGIGDQLRNDIKEGEPNGGQYIYIRLRNLHSSLKELGKSGRHKIRGKERSRYLRMPLQKVRDVHSNKFNSSQKTLERDRSAKYEDYVDSENGTLSVNPTPNPNYFKNELSISGNPHSNNSESGYAKNTFTLPKLTDLGLNQEEETNTRVKYKFQHNGTDKTVNKSRSPILFHYLERKHESTKDEIITELNNRDGDLWNFSGRKIANKNSEFISSQNESYVSSPYRNLNFTKILNVNRQKRQLQSVIFEKQLSGINSKRRNTLYRQDNSNSERAANVFFRKNILPSRNARMNSVNFLKSPNHVELSVFQFPYHSDYSKLPTDHIQNKYLSRSRKIRDLLRNADRLNRWRILGRSATPGKSLTFLSYPEKLASSQQDVPRPTIRLRNWIRTNIYKDRQPTRISRNLRNSPEIQRKDPEIALYFVLSPDEQRVIKSSTEVERPALLAKVRISQRETEGKPNVGKQFARYVNGESSENGTQITDDWLNSQWIYINALGREQGNSNDETTEVPYLTIRPRFPNIFGTTPAPVTTTTKKTTTTKTTTTKATTTTNKPTSTSTEPTKDPWEDIQNIPSSHKHWEIPNEQWGINSHWNKNYNQWNTAKMPWNFPDGHWEMARRPWYPTNDPWRRDKKPWNSHQDTWKETKQHWTPPVDPWKETKQPWTPPVDPWEKDKKPWDTPNSAWEKENKQWNPPNDPWKPPTDPWKPPTD
ncbi:hypothetical protein AVEN_264777-1, partial [Araneus ventricosus]